MALSTTQDEAIPSTRGSVPLVLVITMLVMLTVALAVYGGDFYLLDVQTRVDHPEFRTLSPGGTIGHGYGIAGTALIFTNLLYLLRRRLARWRLGSMRTWLDIHVFTGLFGSVLVLYHSAFQLRNGVATLTAFSLMLVVISGVIGRYFYALSPQQNEVQLSQALARLQALWPDLGTQITSVTNNFESPRDLQRPTLATALATIPTWIAQARHRRSHILFVGNAALSAVALSRTQKRLLRREIRTVAREGTAAVKITAGAHLLRTWRGLHRFMALLMIVSVTVHIGVAWYFGYRWVFSE